jgi:cytochrome c biogenesis protein CcmG, thiol:disulfide interchange protein DsbE
MAAAEPTTETSPPSDPAPDLPSDPAPAPGAGDGESGGGGDGGGAEPGGPPAGPRRGRRPRPIFLLLGVVLAVALGIGLFTGVGTGGPGGRPVAGDPVPSFTLPRIGGGAAVGVPTDGGGNGKPAVLLFYASWCTPCQAEVPAIAATYRHEQRQHSRLASTVALLGVVGNDPTATALRFLRQSGVTFPSGADSNFTVTDGLFYFSDLPESVFVSGTGTIADVHYGAISATAFVRWQHRLLDGG